MRSKFGALAFFLLMLVAAFGLASAFSDYVFGKPFTNVIDEVIFYLMHRRQ
jgi:hypothetical protein